MAVKDISSIPDGTRVFVDTNIFFLYFASRSSSCTAFFQKLQFGDITPFVNSRVMLDLIHKLMLVEAVQKGLILDLSAKKLKEWLSQNRARAGLISDYQTYVEKIFDLKIEMIRTTKQLLVETKTERTTHALLAGDSLHLGCMNHLNPAIIDLATNDDDFDHVPNITVWKPMDVV